MSLSTLPAYAQVNNSPVDSRLSRTWAHLQAAMAAHQSLTSTARAVLLQLAVEAVLAGGPDGSLPPELTAPARLQRIHSVSERSLYVALMALEDAGLIIRETRQGTRTVKHVRLPWAGAA